MNSKYSVHLTYAVNINNQPRNDHVTKEHMKNIATLGGTLQFDIQHLTEFCLRFLLSRDGEVFSLFKQHLYLDSGVLWSL